MNDTDTYLLPLGICQPLELAEVQEATLLPQTESQEYSVLVLQFTVEPLSALFHATVSMNTSPPSLHMWHVTDIAWPSTPAAYDACMENVKELLRHGARGRVAKSRTTLFDGNIFVVVAKLCLKNYVFEVMLASQILYFFEVFASKNGFEV